MRTLVNRALCPHCWLQFPPHDVLWVAEHESLRGDHVLGPTHRMRFLPSRFNAQGQPLDARGVLCHTMACPRCHQVLPEEMLTQMPLIFSSVGLPFSGKSYYLTSLSWQLRRTLPTQFGILISDVIPEENQLLIDHEQAIFNPPSTQDMVQLPKTQISEEHYTSIRMHEQTVWLAKPFMFRMRLTARHPNAASAPNFSQVLCLYDNAGEHFLPGVDSPAARGTQHLAESRVLLFLFDPTQEPSLREAAKTVSDDPQLHETRPYHRQDTLLTEMANRVRRDLSLQSHERLGKPMIVLVTKSDIWGPLLEDEDLSQEPIVSADQSPDGIASVDVSRMERVSAKLRALLFKHVPEFVASAEDTCDPVLYLPVSALGTSPREVGDNGGAALKVKREEIHPHWTTAPFLYSYAKWSTGLFKVSPAGGATQAGAD